MMMQHHFDASISMHVTYFASLPWQLSDMYFCHNFIRDSVIYADDFRNYKDDFPKDLDDEYGIGVFHDYIAVMLLS
jgi:hypothetical protein